ncbi:hypothetical protein AB0D57_22930 [Streptomyces sp. NPDC048275]|uniref:hypothetical protein n=1 Tax=Streptomyces sp. NPDC048275 TaxID=3155629 RepID=UPI0033EC6854
MSKLCELCGTPVKGQRTSCRSRCSLLGTACREQIAKHRAVVRTPCGAERLAAAGIPSETVVGRLRQQTGKGARECLAEGTQVWLSDGTMAPIERVVAERLSVLAYDRQ